MGAGLGAAGHSLVHDGELGGPLLAVHAEPVRNDGGHGGDGGSRAVRSGSPLATLASTCGLAASSRRRARGRGPGLAPSL